MLVEPVLFLLAYYHHSLLLEQGQLQRYRHELSDVGLRVKLDYKLVFRVVLMLRERIVSQVLQEQHAVLGVNILAQGLASNRRILVCLVIVAIQSKLLLVVDGVIEVKQQLSIIHPKPGFYHVDLLLPRIIVLELTKRKIPVVFDWQIFTYNLFVIIDDVDHLVRHRWKQRSDVVNFLGCHFAIGAWFGHSNFPIFCFFECLVDMFYAIVFFVCFPLMCFMRKNSLFHLMRVKDVCSEWICDFATIGVNLVVIQVLGRNNDLLALFNFLLALKWIVRIFVAQDELELLTHLFFEFLG